MGSLTIAPLFGHGRRALRGPRKGIGTAASAKPLSDLHRPLGRELPVALRRPLGVLRRVTHTSRNGQSASHPHVECWGQDSLSAAV